MLQSQGYLTGRTLGRPISGLKLIKQAAGIIAGNKSERSVRGTPKVLLVLLNLTKFSDVATSLNLVRNRELR